MLSVIFGTAYTVSCSEYIFTQWRRCARYPARFPSKLPQFFIDFLTDEDDFVLDIFAGSNTTGEVANKSNRRWLSFEISKDYCSSSVLKFLDNGISDKKLIGLHHTLLKGQQIDLKEHSMM